MANQRSSNSRLLAIGFAVLVVGVLLVLVIIRNADDDPAAPSPAATSTQQPQDTPTDQQTPLTPEQLQGGRLSVPLDVPEGTEAMAMRMTFVRSVAAIPRPGDHVNVYRFLSADDAEGGTTTQQPEPSATPTVASRLPDAGPDSELFLTDMEVLGVTGPLPAANDGVLTVVLAVPSADVPGLMPLADDAQLWFTLLPAQDDASDAPTDGESGTEEAS